MHSETNCNECKSFYNFALYYGYNLGSDMLAIATLFVIGLISCNAKLCILERDRFYKFTIKRHKRIKLLHTYIYLYYSCSRICRSSLRIRRILVR